MKQRAIDLGRIDTTITRQLKVEVEPAPQRVNVLTRVCSVVKSLASHGLPFRGTEEKYGSSVANSGNFIMAMELVAECDPFLSQHISKYGNPDVTHIDQLSFIIRYVLPIGEPVERFIGFIDDAGHKAESSQSYDNAKNMSGIYSGVQVRIKDVISLADIVPCSAHSLNLVGMYAASCFEHNKKKSAYDCIISKYSFILKIYELDPSEIREDAKKLRNIYKQDLDESFENECVNFQSVLKLTINLPKTLLNMKRLNSLVVLNIEATLTKSLNYSDVKKTLVAK
ncbi:uncharacterized protein LOC112686517 [Sipha flava]|uniref:Uncharacterized protein LOC112686517 n=1 Tax=Sipha flava TaxID=143950 RepID=A0A8B8FUY5_9HEMI|nr:uncharacterized protein LOC112686517 [Sipha flava]